MKISVTAMLLLLLSSLGNAASAALFMDDFNTANSANNYVVLTSSADNSVGFAFDYSSVGIPVAPNTTDASTLGLRMASNLSLGAVAGVTLHTNQSFTGAYRVNFDAWINANGPFPGGGGGSTEYLTAGVGGNGTAVNLPGSGSGGWTAVSGEGGSTRDYRMYKDGAEQFAESGQFAAGNSSTSGGAHNNSDAYYAQFGSIDVGALPTQGGMASQTGTTAVGTFGFAWHEVELLVDPAGTMTWSIDGLAIGTLDASVGTTFSIDGRVTIGYMDIFTSVSDNATYSFGLVDNLSVTAVPEPSAGLACICLGVVATQVRRRRAKA
ncbi:MAG: hypothetical protein KDB22_16370 [Planctomycetales bacterium]|nr:hypothetical protein [Planctomycetales bacterium]